MSNLYGSLSGERKDVTKCGHKLLEGDIRGWDNGVRVVAKHSDTEESFYIYITSGSNATRGDKLIATLINGNLRFI